MECLKKEFSYLVNEMKSVQIMPGMLVLQTALRSPAPAQLETQAGETTVS